MFLFIDILILLQLNKKIEYLRKRTVANILRRSIRLMKQANKSHEKIPKKADQAALKQNVPNKMVNL